MAREQEYYNPKPVPGYMLLKKYIALFHNHFYYRKTYWVDRDNIPDEGPVFIVSDHQNGLADPLGYVAGVRVRNHRRQRLIARGDAFKPGVKKALRWLGILPAYRYSVNGEGSAAKNRTMLEEGSDELLNDGTLVIYPEAGHQDKRWLGRFSPGYLVIAFEAARKSGFQKDIKIQPSCNHYSDYFSMRAQMLLKFGKPISLAPYYERYQQDAKRTMLEVNETVHKAVAELMLNITDLENYDRIDYLRETYGIGYAERNGFDPRRLPEKLLADQKFFAELEERKSAQPEKVQGIYDKTQELIDGVKSLGVDPVYFGKKVGFMGQIVRAVGLLALLPLFVFACVPNALVYFTPRLITSKIKDRLQHSGIIFAAMVVIMMPILYPITFALVWIFTGCFLIALAHLLLLPFLGVFAWYYGHWFNRWRARWRWRCRRGKGKLDGLALLRTQIYASLDEILK